MKHQKVSEFAQKMISDPAVSSKFYKLMIQWDGRRDVGSAFYDLDVLQMKLQEAKGATK